jgi:uncharacterized protein (TIGR00255 family)
MTGFARAARSLGGGQVVVTLKSVNHRGLDIHLHAPREADPFESAIRARIKIRVARGHMDVRISLPGASGEGSAPAVVNQERLAQYIAAFRAAAAAHGLDAQPDLNSAFRIPAIFGESVDQEPAEGTEVALLEALEAALDELTAFQEREAAELALEMRKHNAQVAQAAEEMEKIQAGATAAFQKRLHERLADLLGGVQIDPQRLAQEAALLAERSDIGEELARLRIHSTQIAAVLEGGGEVGKRLDFLLQEMNRESNTILSKTSGAGEAGLRITELGLAAKSSIEKIREQCLNLA